MIKPGMTIRIREQAGDGNKFTYTKWKVIKEYPYHVLCENKQGVRTCFSYGDLIINGYAKQSGELEALRKESN